MARTHDSRRFYIDQVDAQAVIRTVPVRRGDAAPEAGSTPATHQYTTVAQDDSGRRWRPGLPSRRVGQLLRTARRRSHHPVS